MKELANFMENIASISEWREYGCRFLEGENPVALMRYLGPYDWAARELRRLHRFEKLISHGMNVGPQNEKFLSTQQTPRRSETVRRQTKLSREPEADRQGNPKHPADSVTGGC